jgi:DNA invertase Pin-like site-specific DNA recombinase
MDAVLYAAKSTADPKGSIATQLQDGRELCEGDGLAVLAEYEDEAKSAYHGSRGDGLVKAREHAERIASERGACALVVQHSDRLARGDGVQAQHLVELVLWANKAGVTIRSVQDPRACESILDAALMGMRNHEDSARKSEATKAGMRRAVIERGEFRGGIVPGGYEVARTIDGRGRVTRRLVKHAEDEPAYELMWRLAEAGKSLQAISLEMSRRGYVTRPVRRDHKPKPFDVSRISQTLENPLYAGLARWRDEIVPGQWPAYVEPEVFWRLKKERAARCSATKRRVGRPPEGHLLSELARCGECGSPLHAQSSRRPRRDGQRSRFYICRAHRDHHRDSAEWCGETPWNAIQVDRMVLSGLDALLGDAAALREQMTAGRRAELDKLAGAAKAASGDAKAAERAAERATAEFADAEDDDERALLKDAAKAKRREAAQARTRMDAALDALARAEEEPDADADRALARVWESLSASIADAKGDVKVINAALHERFERFELHRDHIVPVLRADVLWGAARERADEPPYKLYAPSPAALALPAFAAS